MLSHEFQGFDDGGMGGKREDCSSWVEVVGYNSTKIVGFVTTAKLEKNAA